MTTIDVHNIERRLDETLDMLSYEKINMNPHEVESSLRNLERTRYKEEFYESMSCNLGTCRYNESRTCTNKDKRKECIEVSRRVLCMEGD